MSDLPDRAAMTVADKLMCDFLIERRNWVGGHRLAKRDEVAAALSSHGLRELIEANEHAYQALMGRHDRQDALIDQRRLREPNALLGEPPTVKGEK